MQANCLMGEKNTQKKNIIEEYYSNLYENWEQIAIIYRASEILFRDLEILSNRLAEKIKEYEGGRIGVLAERSPFFLISILAIFKINAVYVPLIPSMPDNRLENMIQQAEVRAILAEEQFSDKVQKLKMKCSSVLFTYLYNFEDDRKNIISVSEKMPEVKGCEYNNIIHEDNGAYILFTSGSSGTPKGVMVKHKGMMNMLNSAYDIWKLCKDDIIVGMTQFGFDMSIPELMLPLAKGIRLLLLDDECCNNPKKALNQIKLHRATVFQTTPSRFKQLITVPKSYRMLASIRRLLLGGEIIDKSIVKYVKQKMQCKFYNTYGLTETSVFSTVKEINDEVTVGTPIYNTEIYIVDEELRVLPENEKGEICIGGAGLGKYLEQGYNEQRLVRIHPDFQEVYLTGDFGYIYQNELYYIGRSDNQIKINGYRIEIQEIVNCILESELVFDALILSNYYAENSIELVAYIIPKMDYKEEKLQQYLKLHIPTYMIPHKFVCVPEYPLNSNGKIDYTELRKNDKSNKEIDYKGYTELEIQLIRIWETVLNVKVDICDNFFDLGGDSLKYYMMLSMVLESLNCELFDVPMYEVTTIEKMARIIQKL